MKYHVTYYYLATGMEGIPYTRDFGIISASSENDAKSKIALLEYPKDEMYGPNNAWSSRDFLKGCLTAKELK